MPRRDDLRSVLVIGSGPIVIGQACEFDYSGTQACRVLRAEGIRVSLVNSNPATIMTDPEFADATYVEPITTDVLEKVIAAERPDAVLPTLGGQTALNAAVALHESGALARYGVGLIGANIETITAGEDRSRFKQIVTGLGAEVPASRICHTMAECEQAAAELGYPVVIRPSFTLGGAGSGIAHDAAGLRRIAGAMVTESPVCTPIGSMFSIEQTTTTLSWRSRISSSSNSFQPRMDSSSSTSVTGLASSPAPATRRRSATPCATPEPAPPRVNDGRSTTG